jgi:hypothetical protein
MGKQRSLYKNWKRAKQQLDDVFENSGHSVVVHYSCESFYDRENNPRSPRVTSIAVRNLDSGQTRSFSIHIIAERRGLLDSIEQHYDQLEREMLQDFFEEVRVRQHCKWVHWNMRDANYGFEALENRIRALGGTPVSVPEANRYDLSRLLVSIYGTGYIAHPRLDNLMKRNHVTARDFLTGPEEAAAFEEKQFVRLHQSTLRKVDVLANLAGRAHAGDLKTLASWWEVNGRSIKATGEWLREHWLLGGLVAMLGVAGAIAKFSPLASSFFGR